MKTVGIIGGMSWESTAEYYRLLNEGIGARCGGLTSAKILLHSVEFGQIEEFQRAGNWDACGKILGEAARGLESIGADFLLLATNTMHKVLPQMVRYVEIPFLHIADATAKAIADAGLTKVALLGTEYTMKQDFYKGRLEERGLTVLIPDEDDMKQINRIIFEELCMGKTLESSKAIYLSVIDQLAARGAEGIILGCTEIGLLIHPEDTALPLFDTTKIHVEEAIQKMLDE
ncbi:MAG: aspartate/glutamate racemase family protein [Tissierellia bacterium]|nr:aspartate/glutamate racemase family protein [Tissierellia bacterium]